MAISRKWRIQHSFYLRFDVRSESEDLTLPCSGKVKIYDKYFKLVGDLSGVGIFFEILFGYSNCFINQLSYPIGFL